ncbi:MAG: BamA/TamA family outer membrane protein [Calditrichaceae bacterium]
MMMNPNYSKILCRIFILTGILLTGLRAGNDSLVTLIPGANYQAGKLHGMVLGNGYRGVWSTPLKVRQLDLNTFAGGLTPLKRGGGLQTNSLRFKGADGKTWVFRSVDKFPGRALPEELKGTIIETFGKDQIGLMLPFGSLIVDKLADTLGVLHSKPYYFVMPHDTLLGEYYKDFAGLLGSIEERTDENEEDIPGFAGSDKIIGTEKFSKKLDEDPREKIDARAYLTARLLDIFVGDWDRHADQWRWARFKSGDIHLWKPIARDRDFAFVVYDGIIPSIIDKRWVDRGIDGFNKNIPDIISLTHKARYLDARLLSSLTKDDWRLISENFVRLMDDRILEDAVKTLPEEIYNQVGRTVVERLKIRRDQMIDLALSYYRHLAKAVDIQLTDRPELLEISRLDKGDVQLTISEREKQNSVFYSRIFTPQETDEIRIYMLGGDDDVKVLGDGDERIIIRIIGGKGDDQLSAGKSEGKILFYDTVKGFKVKNGGDAKVIRSKKKSAYARPPIGYPESRLTHTLQGKELQPPFDYGSVWMPVPIFGYDRDNGLFLGGGAQVTKYGFRADPYVSRHKLSGSYVFRTTAFQIEYNGDFYELIPGMWLKFDVKTAVPEDKPNYFGYGNDSKKDENLEEDHFYRARNNHFRVDIKGIRKILPSISVRFDLSYQYLFTELDEKSLIRIEKPYGIDIHHTFGLGAGFTYDTRDNEIAARRGLLLDGSITYYPEMMDNNQAYTRVNLTGKSFLPLSTRATIALRSQVRQILGEFPYYHAAYIGGVESLRGYNIQRFAGDLSATGGAEIRFFLKRMRIIFPSDVGVIGFTDAGRIWYEDKSPDGWHSSFGGGVYFAPVNRNYTASLNVARSDDGVFTYWKIGFAF